MPVADAERALLERLRSIVRQGEAVGAPGGVQMDESSSVAAPDDLRPDAPRGSLEPPEKARFARRGDSCASSRGTTKLASREAAEARLTVDEFETSAKKGRR